MKSTAKIAIASPKIKLCCPRENAKICIQAAIEAEKCGADIIVFPELTLTGATAGDLYKQQLLLKEAELALSDYIKGVSELGIISFIGLPILAKNDLYGEAIYNAVAAISEGKILGITVSGLSTGVFAPAPDKDIKINISGAEAIVSRSHIYTDDATRAKIFVKIGDDNAYVKGSANIILNPTATPEYIGLARERRHFARRVSAATRTLFVMAGASDGESGTDGIYASARVVANEGKLVYESPLFFEEILL